MTAATRRKESADDAMTAARAVRRHELFRIAVADLDRAARPHRGRVRPHRPHRRHAAGGARRRRPRGSRPTRRAAVGTRLLVVGMGRLGGARDGLRQRRRRAVRPPARRGRRRGGGAGSGATLVVQELRRLLGAAGPDPQLGLDADLRPEGKNGPLVRSARSPTAPTTSAGRWSGSPRRCCGPRRSRATPSWAGRSSTLVDPLRWPAGGLTASTTCARSARSRPGWRPSGCPGAPTRRRTSSWAWAGSPTWSGPCSCCSCATAPRCPRCGRPRTLAGLAAAREAGLLPDADADALRAAWQLASRLRNAGVLWRGRPVEALPSDLRDADGVGPDRRPRAGHRCGPGRGLPPAGAARPGRRRVELLRVGLGL